MEKKTVSKWPDRLDRFCAITGALLPMGIVVGNAAYESMLAVVGLCWTVRCLWARENPVPDLFRHPFVWPWCLMFASILISLAVNGPGGKGAAHDIVFLRHLLFLGAMLDISRRLAMARYFLMGMVGCVVLVIINLISVYTLGSDLMGKPLIRYTGKLKESSRIAGLFAYIGPMSIAWSVSLVSLSKKYRGLLLALGLAALVVLAQMRVRTAILASGAGLSFWVLYLLYKRYSYKSLFIIAPIVAIAAGLCAFYLAGQPMDSMYDRFGFYKIAWAVFLDHPVVGVGISSFQDACKAVAASGEVMPYVSPDGRQWLEPEMMHAHNLMLMILTCTGVVGLVVWGWLFFRIVKVTFVGTDESFRSGLVLWPVIFLVIGLTGWNFFANWYHALYVYLAVLSGTLLNDGMAYPDAFRSNIR